MSSNTVELRLMARDEASSVINGVVGNLKGLIGQMAAMAGIAAGGAGFMALVGQGVKFNKTMEDSKLGLAALIMSTNDFRKASGAAATEQEALGKALQMSAQLQEELKVAARTTAASYEDLVTAFQTAYGPATAVGINNLSKLKDVVVQGSLAVSALGLDARQMSQELRAIFTGEQGPSNTLNRVLRITKEELEGVREAGGDVAQMLLDKLKPFALAATVSLKNLSVMVSNLKDSMQQSLGTAMLPLFNSIKKLIEGIAGGLGGFQNRLNEIGKGLATMLDKAAPAIEELIDLVMTLVQQIVEIGAAVSGGGLVEMLRLIKDLIVVTDGWAIAIAGAVYALGGFKGAYALLGTGVGLFKRLGAETVALAGSIEGATGAAAGLSGALATIGTAAAFAGAIWGIQQIIEGLKTAAELKREWDREDESKSAGADQMKLTLQNFRDRLTATTELYEANKDLIADTWQMQKTITDEMAAQNELSTDTVKEFNKLFNVLKAAAPLLKDTRGISVAPKGPPQTDEEKKAAEAALKDARKRAKEMVDATNSYSKDLAKARDAFLKEQAGVLGILGDGLGAGIAEIKAKFQDAEKTVEAWLANGLVKPDAAAKLFAGLKEGAKREIDAFVAEAKKIPSAFVKSLEMPLPAFGRIARAVSELREEYAKGILTAQEYWSALAPVLYAGAETVADGLKAGHAAVMATLKTAGQSAADAFAGVWAAASGAFNDLFFNVITGKLDSLGDVFRGFADNMASVFANLVTEMVQRWLQGQQTIAEGWASLNESMLNDNGNLSVQGGVMAAGVGYGIGGMVGQGTQYNQAGAAVGAVIGAIVLSAIPVLGTILGAVIGGLIGELFNKNTEKSMLGTIGGMVGATRTDRVPVYAPRDPGRGPLRPGEEEPPPEIIGWRDVPSIEAPKSAFDVAGKKVFEAQTAALADIFRVGAKDQARALTEAYQKALKESLGGAWVKIAAGSDEDIQKDAEYVLKNLLPRIGLSAAFGQTGYLPHGNRDAPGGIPGVNWGMPGMDEAGNWTGAKLLFDPEAPIPKLLAGIGFTNEKIAEIAGKISTEDPEKLLAYIGDLVGIVVEFGRLGTEMGKSLSTLWGEFDKAAATSAGEGFGEAASDIADLFNSLDLYSGDEQIEKAKEAQQASSALWESVLDYLATLQQLVREMTASITAQRTEMRDVVFPQTDAEKIAGATTTIDGGWGKLLGAKTADEAIRAAEGMREAIDVVFQIMAERLKRGRALLETFADIGERLGSISADVAGDLYAGKDPLGALGEDLVDIQQKVSEAARMTGLDQIAAMEDVSASAEEMYGKLRNFLNDIASTSASISKSIESQIWELGVGEMDATGQAGAVTDRIRALQEQLKVATSPAEIAAITAEIQSLTTRYVGTFAKDDAKRGEAIEWAQQQLRDADTLAQDTLDRLREVAEAQAAELERITKAAGKILTDNVNEAAETILTLSHTLGELDRVFGEVIDRLGTEVLDALEPLREAMEGASEIFTNATVTTGDALTNTETGLEAQARRSAVALGEFEVAVRAAAAALSGVSGAKGTTTKTADAGASTTTSAQIVSTVRRFSGQLVPRVG